LRNALLPCSVTFLGCDYRILFRIKGWVVVVLVGPVFRPLGVGFHNPQQDLQTLACRSLSAFQAGDPHRHLIHTLYGPQRARQGLCLAGQGLPFLPLVTVLPGRLEDLDDPLACDRRPPAQTPHGEALRPPSSASHTNSA
jgi:hypothetical protein